MAQQWTGAASVQPVVSGDAAVADPDGSVVGCPVANGSGGTPIAPLRGRGDRPAPLR